MEEILVVVERHRNESCKNNSLLIERHRNSVNRKNSMVYITREAALLSVTASEEKWKRRRRLIVHDPKSAGGFPSHRAAEIGNCGVG